MIFKRSIESPGWWMSVSLAFGLHFAPLVPASHGAEDPLLRCGSHCLFVAAKLFDRTGGAKFEEFESRLGQPSEIGYTIETLKAAAELNGLTTLPVLTTVDNLIAREGQFACIAHMNGNHFVLVAGLDDIVATVIDPPREYILPLASFKSQWNGAALLISDRPLESEESIARRVWWWLVLKRLTIGLGFVLVGAVVYLVWRRRA